MNEFVGKVCPFCKGKFSGGDDIVVCATCDMPHHKECWIINQRCTTFGCAGTMKYPDASQSTVTATEISYDDDFAERRYIFCTRCGFRNRSDGSFCTQCGNRLVVFPQ